MSTLNLQRVFNPARIAVIGASDSPGSVGRTVMDNLLATESTADVVPVNPRHSHVRARTCVASVAEVDGEVDLAILCTPADTVPELIQACAEAGVGGAIILSAGFGEAGDAGARLQRALGEAVGESGLRLLGPNCLGVLSPHHHLNASFAQTSALPGRTAFASQSGALCTSMLDWARQADVGFSHFVSLGNMVDVDFGDLVEAFADDERTGAVVLYIESVSDAQKLLHAARRCVARKPIIACNSGRFAASAEAASSHTGAMAGEDAVFAAAFRRAGIQRALHVGELFGAAQLLSRHTRVGGPRLAIVTNAGGPGVLATDAVVERGVKLAELAKDTKAKLEASLPEHASRDNPIDVLGDADAERYAGACEAALADEGVDALLVILTPQAMTEAPQTAEALAPLAARSDKPVLAAFMGGASVDEAVRTLQDGGVPSYRTPEDAVTAFAHLVGAGARAEAAQEQPPPGPGEATAAENLDGATHEVLRQARRAAADSSSGEGVLDEAESCRVLGAFGIPVAETRAALSVDEALRHAQHVGYPVVLKVRSPRIAHKSDVGGVALGLEGPEEVREAFERVLRGAAKAEPGAQHEGVTVQAMALPDDALELIVGAKRDPTFGPVVMVGLGGTTAEVLRDRTLELAPLDRELALKMLRDLRGWPLLEGHRGKPGVALDALCDALVRVSHLALALEDLKSLDINPLLASAEEVRALDARLVLAGGDGA